MAKLDQERSLAARVASWADLQDVRLFGATTNLVTPAIEGSLSYSMSSDVQFQTVGDADLKSLIVTGEYKVAVLDEPAGDDDDDESETVADIEFTLAALYELPPRPEDYEPYSTDELEAFAATTGQFALYPYAREFISDITSRMGLPALHIGALRFQLDSRDGEYNPADAQD